MSAKKAKTSAKKSKPSKPAAKATKVVKKSKASAKVAVKKIIAKKPVKKIIKKTIAKVKKTATKKIIAKKLPIKQPIKTKAKKVEKTKEIAKEKKLKTPKKEVAKAVKKVEKKATEVVLSKIASKNSKTNDFKIGDHAVYPSHGIGKIIDIEKIVVLGNDFSCYLMLFEKEKLTIKIPLNNSEKIGLRPLASKVQMEEVFTILRSGIKKLKGMWSRRAQEYETKINSGNIILLAEVLRDLTRDIEDGERSYSERIIYETAVARLAAEYAAIYKIDFEDARNKVIITAKDKLGSEEKSSRDDVFDYKINKEIDEESEEDEIEEDIDEEDEEDDSYDDDDDDDDAPRKKRKK